MCFCDVYSENDPHCLLIHALIMISVFDILWKFHTLGGTMPSHLRGAIFGPSKWLVYLGSVRAISGPPSRQRANRSRPAAWDAVSVCYFKLLTRGPSTAHFLPIWYLQMRRPG